MSLRIRNFQELVDRCVEVEGVRNRKRKNGADGPIRSQNQGQGSNQKGKQQEQPYNKPQGNNQGQYRPMTQNSGGGGKGRRDLTCFRCGKTGHFTSKSPTREVLCFNCNKPGHLVKDCKAPKGEPSVNAAKAKRRRSTTKGRVFCMGGKEAKRSGDLTQRNYEIEGNSLSIIFDSNAAHCFITLECVSCFKITCDCFVLA